MSRNGTPRRQAQPQSLQQAASTIFVLMALIPFLVFVYLAHHLDAMRDLRVQLGLALALGISVLGFSVLVTTMRRTSSVLKMLVAAQSAHPAARAVAPSVSPSAARTSPDGDARPAATGKAAHAHATAKAAATFDFAPAIGAIRELRDAADAVGRKWKLEAERLVGRAVRVDVVNLEQPEEGILVRVTDDGIVLGQSGDELGVLWRLVSSIELYAKPETVPGPTT